MMQLAPNLLDDLLSVLQVQPFRACGCHHLLNDGLELADLSKDHMAD